MVPRLLTTLRRDLSAVFGPLFGRREPPAEARDGRGWAAHRVGLSTPRLPAGAAAALPDSPQALTIVLGGRARELQVLPGQTLLQAGLGAGLAMPHSCALGGCGACRSRLLEGEVRLRVPNCLSERERRAGYVLACVAHPLGPVRLEIR